MLAVKTDVSRKEILLTMLRRPHLAHADGSPMAKVIALSRRVAATDFPVWVSGEPGTGKETLARLMHEGSARVDRPFVRFPCAAVPETQVQSLLFGSGRPGAVNHRSGALGEAGSGTLYLEDVENLPLPAQGEMVGVLDQSPWAWGGYSEGSPHVRVVASSTRDLLQLVTAGRFRRDLYDMLACNLAIPPLRARPEDAPEIFTTCWATVGAGRGVQADGLLQVREHSWPGNVRELEAFSFRLAVACAGKAVTADDVARLLLPASDASSDVFDIGQIWGAEPPVLDSAADTVLFDLPGVMRRLEESAIRWALARAKGNKQAAARMLGLRRTTLVEKLRRKHWPRGGERAESRGPGARAATASGPHR